MYHNKHVSSSATCLYSYVNRNAFAGLDRRENMLTDETRCSNTTDRS